MSRTKGARRGGLWGGVVAASVAIGLAAACSSAAKPVAWGPQSFTLANGMQVVVLPDHRAPVVTQMVWYKVGASDDPPGKSGIAHFFEHLMFKATDEIKAGEFSKIVARNGGQDNAQTSNDYTMYYERVAKDRLPQMMHMEVNRMTNLHLDDSAVIPEREVIKEERRQNTDGNPGAVLGEKVFAALYAGHPYSVPVIGHMEEMAKLSGADAQEFYKRWYGPENAILVLSGDVEASEVRPLVEKEFGSVKRKGDLHKREWPAVAGLSKAAEVSHTDPKVRQEDWSRYWLAVPIGDPQVEALAVGAEILGGGRTSRLNRELVENQKIAVSAYAFADGDSLATGVVGVGAQPAPGVTLGEVKVAALAELAKFLDQGPTLEEVQRAKERIAAAAIFRRDSQFGLAMWYGEQLVRGRTLDDIAQWEQRVRAVTPEQIKAAWNAYARSDKHVDASLIAPAGAAAGAQRGPAPSGPPSLPSAGRPQQ